MEDLKKGSKYIFTRICSTILPSKYNDISEINPETKCRIVDPLSQLIPKGDYKEVEKGFGSRTTTVRVMETSHGFYMKPKEDAKLFEACYENTFHFGLSCKDFDPERVVYFPKRDC